ncbi:MAG: putative metal-binding motif-containing protein, partial [Deltaproteobacteria bacterium]|nr:putative metal-binding motif-containing protein [Deltaproteobacteria bacterium]
MYRLKRISFLVCLTLAVFVLRGCGDEQARQTCQADSCSGHGTCDDGSDMIVCDCDQGYAGDICDSCTTGYQDYGDGECLPSDPCAEDTACAAQNRVCTDDQGSAVCGDCLAGYHDEAGTCVTDESCLATSCSGHGTCDDTGGVVNCTCDDHYIGDHCEACEAGYVFWPADSGICVADPCDPYPCNVPNAVADGCVQTDVDAFDCTCEAGYAWDDAACAPDCEDADNDGYGTGAGCAGADCDDNDPDVFEGNLEVCDGKNNDCDTETDENLSPPDCPLPDTGVCQAATASRTCQGAAGWSVCDYGSEYEAEETLCD